MPYYNLPLAAIVLAFIVVGCSSGPAAPNATSYIESIVEKRLEKDQFFRENSSESPVPVNQQDEFLPLNYFPVNPALRVPAAIRVADKQPIFEMPTSTGTLREMRQVGTLEFLLKGQTMTLGAFVDANQSALELLFVPFSDLTTGTETYEAGRYLDIERTATGIYVVDFNEAYSPYCAYNATYECPYPPASNRLKVRIEAGERLKTLTPDTSGAEGAG